MNLKDQGRREPTMADLEAFERLLRESLNQGVGKAAAQPATPPAATMTNADALAELTRLVDEPLPFDLAQPRPDGAEPRAPEPAVSWQHLEAIPQHAQPAPQPAIPQPQHDPYGQFDLSQESAQAVAPAVTYASAVYAPPSTVDPLAAFEEELRRFDQQKVAPPVTEDTYAWLDAAKPVPQPETTVLQPQWQDGPDPLPRPEANSSLAEAEQRLAAEAALAAAAAGAVAANAKRSRKVFYGLGAVAVAGLAAIGLTFALGGKPQPQSASVPVVAAKQEPMKERPANLGGVEIPDQNRQVLAPRAAAEPPKPAQAVNTTEQPVDLQQVTRRDSVRVVAPSPFQSPPAPTTEAPVAPPAASVTTPESPEPRRVQSVRLGDPAPPQPVAQAQTPSVAPGAVAAGAATIAALSAGTTPAPAGTPVPPVSPPRAATPAVSTPVTAPPATPPVVATPPTIPAAPSSATAAPKVESRPQSAAAVIQPPRPAQPTTPPAPRPVQPAAPRGENAPLSLSPPRPQQAATAPARAAGAGGGWSVQLASRPTADDARSASGQLGSRFAAQLGRGTTVVSGEANGRTVFRVRAQGYSQAEANAACDRVKASGGQCFVTR